MMRVPRVRKSPAHQKTGTKDNLIATQEEPSRAIDSQKTKKKLAMSIKTRVRRNFFFEKAWSHERLKRAPISSKVNITRAYKYILVVLWEAPSLLAPQGARIRFAGQSRQAVTCRIIT